MNSHFPRSHALDALRASMMLLGVFLHAACGYASLPDIWFFKDRVTSIWMDATILVIHLFRMPVFYVMAGFFAALLYSRRGWKGLLKNRAARILAPFVLGIVIFSPILRPMGAYFWFAARRPNPWESTVHYMTSGRWLRQIEPDHMWFLEYLVFLYLIGLFTVPVVRRLNLGRVFLSVNRSPAARVFLWSGLTFVTLLPMEFGLLDTPDGFRFQPHIVAAYCVFFFFGWALYHHRQLLGSFQRYAWTQVALACGLSGANIAFAIRQVSARESGQPISAVDFYGTAATGALVVWLMVFGLIGLFLRYLDRPSPAWRYLSDSAYWLYLFHPPVVVLSQFAVWNVPIHWAWKLLFVSATSLTVLLWTYQAWVRSTWLGVLLNGRRYSKSIVEIEEAPRTAAVAEA